MRFLKRLMSGLVGLIGPSFLQSPYEQAREREPERVINRTQASDNAVPVASRAGLFKSPPKEACPVFAEATKAPAKDRNFVHYMGAFDKTRFEIDGHAVQPEQMQRMKATAGTCERITIRSGDTDYVFWNNPGQREKDILSNRKGNKVIDLGDRNGAAINVKSPLDASAPRFDSAPAQAASFVHYVGQFDESTIDINGTPVSPTQISRFPEKNGVCDRFKVDTPDGMTHVFWNNPSKLVKEFIKTASPACFDMGDRREAGLSLQVEPEALIYPDIIRGVFLPPLEDDVPALRDDLPTHTKFRGFSNSKAQKLSPANPTDRPPLL